MVADRGEFSITSVCKVEIQILPGKHIALEGSVNFHQDWSCLLFSYIVIFGVKQRNRKAVAFFLSDWQINISYKWVHKEKDQNQGMKVLLILTA